MYRRWSVCAVVAAATLLVGPGAAGREAGPAGAIVFERIVGETPELYVIDADGSEIKRLTRNRLSDRRPSVSRDGRRIAFARLGGPLSLWLMNPDGSGQRRLVNEGFESSWAPDGSIFYTETCAGISRVTAAGATRIVKEAGRGEGYRDPAVSPDGSRIAFTRLLCDQDDCHCKVRVIDTAGHLTSDLRKLRVAGANPTWSPDGRRIAFSGEAAVTGVGEVALMIVNRDGTGLRRVAPRTLIASDPAWSPDGLWIAFVGENRKRFQRDLYVIRPDGTHLQRLRLTGIEFSPAWMPRMP